jgi:ferric-dicitrate binding protein FerR (iron transport regulator)
LESYLLFDAQERETQQLFTQWWNAAATESSDGLQQEQFRRIIDRSRAAQQDIDIAEINRTISLHRRKRHLKFAAAAIFVGFILAGISSVLIHQRNVQPDKYLQDNEIVTQRGTKTKVQLPDGTQVWLNSDSRLTYKGNFNGKLREVSLEGEAYFDVVKNPKRPFIVHTSAINIKVLGTAFNVKSYSQDATIEATLVRGLIQVEKNNDVSASKILLRPNEKLVYSKSDNIMSSGTHSSPTKVPNTLQRIAISTMPVNIADSSRQETSWVYGKLLFNGDSFTTLAEKMERWFNVKIVFNNEKVAGYRFTGVFRNENIDEALQALQLIAPFDYVIQGNVVNIGRQKNK